MVNKIRVEGFIVVDGGSHLFQRVVVAGQVYPRRFLQTCLRKNVLVSGRPAWLLRKAGAEQLARVFGLALGLPERLPSRQTIETHASGCRLPSQGRGTLPVSRPASGLLHRAQLPAAHTALISGTMRYRFSEMDIALVSHFQNKRDPRFGCPSLMFT